MGGEIKIREKEIVKAAVKAVGVGREAAKAFETLKRHLAAGITLQDRPCCCLARVALY